jgi:hypothetical protein
VSVDKAGLIYVTHCGKPGSVFVFEPSGKFVKSMGDVHAANGYGIDIREEDGTEYLYLSPSNSNLSFTKMTMNGEVVWKKGKKLLGELSGKYTAKSLYRPTNTSFSPDGGYFLGDGYGSNYLHQFDNNDKYMRTIGGGGNGPGQFRTPHGQWLDIRDGIPKLAVCDRANKRLQWSACPYHFARQGRQGNHSPWRRSGMAKGSPKQRIPGEARSMEGRSLRTPS